jgi:hypothetical protein
MHTEFEESAHSTINESIHVPLPEGGSQPKTFPPDHTIRRALASRTTTPATVTNHLVRCSRSVIILPYVVFRASLLERRTYLNARYSFFSTGLSLMGLFLLSEPNYEKAVEIPPHILEVDCKGDLRGSDGHDLEVDQVDFQALGRKSATSRRDLVTWSDFKFKGPEQPGCAG